MKQKSLAAIFLILLLVSGAAIITVNAEDDESSDDTRTLNVNGEYKLSVDPDTFVATITVETEASSAEDSQRENAQICSRVEKAVKFGHELTTISYNIQPVYEWETCDGKLLACRERQVLVGYKTTHRYSFETSNLDNAGKGLDALVNAGATRVDSIRFEISNEMQDDLELELLEKASENAKEKAESIAKGFGVTLGRPLSISEGYYYVPVYYDYGYETRALSADSYQEPTSIVAGEIDLSARVSVTYEIF